VRIQKKTKIQIIIEGDVDEIAALKTGVAFCYHGTDLLHMQALQIEAIRTFLNGIGETAAYDPDRDYEYEIKNHQ